MWRHRLRHRMTADIHPVIHTAMERDKHFEKIICIFVLLSWFFLFILLPIMGIFPFFHQDSKDKLFQSSSLLLFSLHPLLDFTQIQNNPLHIGLLWCFVTFSTSLLHSAEMEMWVMGVQLICDMEITEELFGGQCELNWQTWPIVQGFQKEIPHKWRFHFLYCCFVIF